VNDDRSTVEKKSNETNAKEKPTIYSHSKQQNEKKASSTTTTAYNKQKIHNSTFNVNKKLSDPPIVKNKKLTKSLVHPIPIVNNKKLKPKRESQFLSSSSNSSDIPYSSTSSNSSSFYTSYNQGNTDFSSSSLSSTQHCRYRHSKQHSNNTINPKQIKSRTTNIPPSKQKLLSDSSSHLYDDYDSTSLSAFSSHSSSIRKSHIPRRKNSSLPPSLYNSFSSSTSRGSTAISPNLSSSQSLSLCSTCFDENTIHKNLHNPSPSSSFYSTYSSTTTSSRSSTKIIDDDFSESFYSSYLSSSFSQPR